MGFQVTEVQKSLKGFDYHGDPEDLAKHAEDNGADDDLVEALRGLDLSLIHISEPTRPY